MEKLTQFIEYLKLQQAEHLEIARQLAADDREDESILEKIHANIFDIFITVSQTPAATSDSVARLMERIPAAWHESLKQAILYKDHEKEAQERVKIAAMTEIEAKFASIVLEGDCNGR